MQIQRVAGGFFLFLLYFPMQEQAVTLNVAPEVISQSGSPTLSKIGKQLYSFKSGCFDTIHYSISFFYREEGSPARHRKLPPQSAGDASLLVAKGNKHQNQPLETATEPGNPTTGSLLPQTPFITPRTRCPQPEHRHRALPPAPSTEVRSLARSPSIAPAEP